MILVNRSGKAGTGTVYLFDTGGQPLSVDMNGTVQAGEFSFSLPPSGVGFFSTGVGDPVVTGSVDVESDVRIGGTILFEGSFSVAGVGSVQPSARFLVPIDFNSNSGVRTGVALASAEEVEVTLQLRGLTGNSSKMGLL